MEKRQQTYTKSFKPVKVYLDDIIKIYEAIHELSDKVTVEIEGYSFTNPTLLAELPQGTIYSLTVRTPILGENSLRVTFEKSYTTITYEDDMLSRGIAEKIEDIIAPRQRFITKLIGHTTALFFMSLAGYWFFAEQYKALSQFIYGVVSLAFLAISAVSGFLVLLIFSQRMNKHSIIMLSYEKDTPNFFKRNKDGIILAVLSAVFGALATLIVQAIVQ